MKAFRVIALLLSLAAANAGAKSSGGASKNKAEAPAAGARDDRQKQIDFDADVVEGMNKQPLDSLSQFSEDEGGRSKNHLYRRTKKFKDEIRESSREVSETY